MPRMELTGVGELLKTGARWSGREHRLSAWGAFPAKSTDIYPVHDVMEARLSDLPVVEVSGAGSGSIATPLCRHHLGCAPGDPILWVQRVGYHRHLTVSPCTIGCKPLVPTLLFLCVRAWRKPWRSRGLRPATEHKGAMC